MKNNRTLDLYLFEINDTLAEAEFFQVSIIFHEPIFLPEQLLSRNKYLHESFYFLVSVFVFNAFFWLLSSSSDNKIGSWKNTCLKKFGKSKEILFSVKYVGKYFAEEVELKLKIYEPKSTEYFTLCFIHSSTLIWIQ